MKHSFLRRFGALALSLAMALTLAVTPAMAAGTPDGRSVTIHDGNNGNLPATIKVGEHINISYDTVGFTPGTYYKTEWSCSGAGSVVFGDPAQQHTTITGGTEGAVTIKVKVTELTGAGGAETGTPVEATCSLTVTPDTTVTNVPVTGITVTPPAGPYIVGGTGQMAVEVLPANASNKAVKWDSTNRSAVTVDSRGAVSYKGKGTATITATAQDGSGVKGSCEITVTGPAGTGFLFSTAQETLNNGQSKVVTLIAQPANAELPAGIAFTSSDPDVVSVTSTTNGTATLTAKAPGAVTITASSTGPDGRAITATLTVKVSGIVIKYDGKKTSAVTLVKGTRGTLVVDAFGAAEGATPPVVWESDNAAVAYVVTGGTVSPRAVGTAVVTATKGNYSASCTVTVLDDTSALITLSSINAGAEISLNGIRSRLNSIAASKGYSAVDYVTNLQVRTDQGILYYGYYYEGDTGDGVGMEQYYLSPRSGQLGLNDLGFVARTTFSGTAEISYTAWCGSHNFSGIIRIPVNAMNDVVYSTTRDRPITFQSIDFNAVCRTKNGRDLRSVTFTLPQASSGTLYFDYDSLGEDAQHVTAGTSYGRTSAPYLDSVTFVPAETCPRTVTIGYQATDVSGRTYNGRVTIYVSGSGGNSGNGGLRNTDVRYTGNWGDRIIFRASDFASASLASIGEQLSYVRFSLPYASQGTLYFNYSNAGTYSNVVSSATSYYPNSAPAIGGVSFVPASTASSRVTMGYTGYGVRGNSFSGTIYIDYGDPTNPTLRYSTYSGKLVNLSVTDFNNACVAATGSTLDRVQFTGLPGNAQGVLYYNYNASSNSNTTVSSWNSYYRSSSGQNQLGRVSFLAGKDYTGTVRIPYTGYSTDRNGTSFTGTVVIQVSAPAPSDINLSTTASSPVRLSAAAVRNVCYAVMDQELSYIQITSLPGSTAGQLYSNYSGGTGSAVGVGARFYRSGNPNIDQLTFVPRNGFQGTATIGYTGVSTSGQQVSGRINITVGRTGTSGYFNDMGGYSWAADAVDYLYRSGVVNGMGNGGFGPSLPIRRCDFVVMLCRAFRLNGGGGYSFADVPVTSYYGEAVATAKSLGIVSGDGANFYPNNNLSRQDAMVMIYNTLKATGHNLTNGLTADLSIFLDQAQISPYARNSVGILVYLGAVKGDGNGYLRPRSTINRAEAAILMQFIMSM